MRDVYQLLINAKIKKNKLLAILIDPDKIDLSTLNLLIDKLKTARIQLIFVGGSNGQMENATFLVDYIKNALDLPTVLFPGHPTHLISNVDAVLFNVLISGNNPNYLINYHVEAMTFLKHNPLEIISNGYILIDGGKESSVQKVTKTLPMSLDDKQKIINTALAAQYLGYKTVYLEAGSGAKSHVPITVISQIKDQLTIPLIVGGGIKSKREINNIFEAGADIVVIGTAFENDLKFFDV